MLGSAVPGRFSPGFCIVSSGVSATRSRGCAVSIAASLCSWWGTRPFPVVRARLLFAIAGRVSRRGHVVPIPGCASWTRCMLLILPVLYFTILVAARLCLLMAGGIVFAIAIPMLASAGTSFGRGIPFPRGCFVLFWLFAGTFVTVQAPRNAGIASSCLAPAQVAIF